MVEEHERADAARTRQFAVISVAARPGDDLFCVGLPPHPLVEFQARGVDVEVSWTGADGSTVATGISFATRRVAGLAALVLSKHLGLTSFQVTAVLLAVSDDVW